jgi:hypothetical protein
VITQGWIVNALPTLTICSTGIKLIDSIWQQFNAFGLTLGELGIGTLSLLQPTAHLLDSIAH